VYRFFNADIVVLYILPRAPAVSTRSWSTFHPLALLSSIRPLYFTVFSFILSGEYLSLQYVNSMNYTINVGLGWFGGIFVFGYCRYMVVANVALYFLEFVHRFFLHSLECSSVI
jgi:hypothetical protein